MGRLIAFDQQTAAMLVARTRTSAQLGHGSPLRAALSNESESTLLMPGVNSDELLIVSVRRPVKSVPPPPVFAPPERVAPAPPVRATAPPITSKPTAQPGTAPATSPIQPVAKSSVATTQPVAKTQPSAIKDDEPVAYEATGFLGLDDSPVYAEDIAEQEKQAKKKWWQKLLD